MSCENGENCEEVRGTGELYSLLVYYAVVPPEIRPQTPVYLRACGLATIRYARRVKSPLFDDTL